MWLNEVTCDLKKRNFEPNRLSKDSAIVKHKNPQEDCKKP